MATCDRNDCAGYLSTDLDPRIRGELETLNSESASINKLENELQAAQLKFIRDKTRYRQKLDVLCEQIGKKFVTKSHTYYELFQRSQKVQAEVRRSAERYSAACTACDRARQVLAAAESRPTIPSLSLCQDGVMTSVNSTDVGHAAAACKLVLDPDKQDELNKAIEMLMSAEREKSLFELEHQARAIENVTLQQRLALALKDVPKAIERSRPFYNLKDQLESQLQALKQTAEDLALALKCSKQRYQSALGSLETISEQLHELRRSTTLLLPPRTPGVGAESAEDGLANWPSTVIDLDCNSDGNRAEYDDISCGSSTAGDTTEAVSEVTTKPTSHPSSEITDSVSSGTLDSLRNNGELDSTIVRNNTITETDAASDKRSDKTIWTDKFSELRATTADPIRGYRDGQADGAEDTAAADKVEKPATSHEQSSNSVPSTNMIPSDDQTSRESQTSGVPETKSEPNNVKKVVPVSMLPTGVYITAKSSLQDGTMTAGVRASRSIDTEARVGVGSEASVMAAATELRHSKREQKRKQLAQQFPLLCNLGGAASRSQQLGSYLN